MVKADSLQNKFRLLWPHLDERTRRMVAATEARQIGYGGISKVSRYCGLSRVTITKGIRELEEEPLTGGRTRRPGAGRPTILKQDPELAQSLEMLIKPTTRGDPESPLRWTCKSTRTLSKELTGRHHPISHEKVAPILRQMDFSLQVQYTMPPFSLISS